MVNSITQMIAIRSGDCRRRSSPNRIDVSRRRHRGNFARGKAGEGRSARDEHAYVSRNVLERAVVIVSFVLVEFAAEAPPHHLSSPRRESG